MKIDVQTHIFPRSFIKEMSAVNSRLVAAPPDQNGRRVILDSKTGDQLTFFVEDSCYIDPKKRLGDMETYGMDVQVLSLPPPGVDKIQDNKQALRLSRLINDDFAEIVSKYPTKFQGLATIPMNDANGAVEEIERSVNQLGFKGVIISSNTNGRFYDLDEYDEVFRTLEKLQIPLFLHPTESIAAKQIGQDYKLALIFGWPFDTTFSIARLVFSGILRKFPELKVIVAHGGGTLPFLAGRIGMLMKTGAGGGKDIIEQDPIRILKQLYFDAAIFDSTSLELVLKFVGPEHILFASDYPFGLNLGRSCYESSVKMMDELNADQSAKEKIYGSNASKLLKI